MNVIASAAKPSSPHGARSSLFRLTTRTLVLVALVGALTTVLLVTVPGNIHPAKLVVVTAMFTAIWVLAFRTVTSSLRAQGLDSLLAAVIGASVGLAAVGSLDYLLLESLISPRRLLLMGGSVFLLMGGFTTLAPTAIESRRRVVFVGSGDEPRSEIESAYSSGTQEFECVGILADAAEPAVTWPADLPVLGRSADLLEVVRTERPHLLVALNGSSHAQLVDRLLDAGITSVPVIDLVEYYERAFHRVANHSMSTSWFVGVLGLQRHQYSPRLKRLLDLVVTGVAFFILLPLLAMIAVAIRWSGGPVFFRQVRSGEGGQPFEVLKFRTMIPDAESGSPVWASADDPRITRIGHFLRRTRLDEVPQLWNVLRGEMSLVGPRPERPEYFEMLQREIPFWSRRLLLKPGITGWAQLHHGYTDDVPGAATKLSYDLYYLKHRSFVLDVLILLATFRLVLTGRGAR